MSMRRITFSFPWPWETDETRDLLAFAFQVALITYLVFYLLEQLSPGLILYTLNLNAVLWTAVVLGVCSTLWPAVAVSHHQTQPATWKTYSFIAALGIASGLIVKQQIHLAEWLGWVIAALTALIVAGLGYLLYFEGDEPIDPAATDQS